MLTLCWFDLVQFGAGHRSCLGKNISLLEIYKVVPTLLRRFDVSIVFQIVCMGDSTELTGNPCYQFELLEQENGEGYQVQNRWFVPQHGFKVRLRRRVREENPLEPKSKSMLHF